MPCGSPTIAVCGSDVKVAHRRASASDSAAPCRLASFMPCCTTAHSPFARDHEGVQVDLEAVGDGVVVDPRRQPAGAHQRFAVQPVRSATARSSSGVLRECRPRPPQT